MGMKIKVFFMNMINKFRKTKEVEVVQRKSVVELIHLLGVLSQQLQLVETDAEEQDNRIKYLENELQKQYEATCEAKDRIVDLLNEKRELERKLAEIHDLTEK